MIILHFVPKVHGHQLLSAFHYGRQSVSISAKFALKLMAIKWNINLNINPAREVNVVFKYIQGYICY